MMCKVEEMLAVLGQNSVQLGGRTLYLKPWAESCEFRRNVIEKFLCWIKLLDVPPTYWSLSELTMIAELICRPLKFDEISRHLQPLKYARVQVELEYAALRPPHVWVPIINSKGEEDKLKVDVGYSQLPYSGSICKSFGHSLVRCLHNPNREAPPPKRTGRQGVPNKDIEANTNVQETTPITNVKSNREEEYLQNREMVPYVVSELLSCDVVIDDDKCLSKLLLLTQWIMIMVWIILILKQ